MSSSTAWRLLSKRNILGAVLLAGIGAGIYLGDIWKGFGSGNGIGIGDPSTKKPADTGDNPDNTKTVAAVDTEPDPEKTSTVPDQVPQVVKVVIDSRSYYLRSATGDKAVPLKQIVSLAGAAVGDVDGIRIRVYRKPSSYAAAEIALRDALVAAGITDEQTVWVANPIDD